MAKFYGNILNQGEHIAKSFGVGVLLFWLVLYVLCNCVYVAEEVDVEDQHWWGLLGWPSSRRSLWDGCESRMC